MELLTNGTQPEIASNVPPGVTVVSPTPPAPIVQPQMVQPQPQMVQPTTVPMQIQMPVQESFFDKVDWMQFAVMTTVITAGLFLINYFSTKKKSMNVDLAALNTRLDTVEGHLQSLAEPPQQQ